MSRKALFYGGVPLGIFLLIGSALLIAANRARDADALPPPSPAKVAEIRAAVARISPLAPALPKPGPRDWLAQHKESGQTLDEYIASDPNRPTRRRTTLYIQPLGDLSATDRKLVAATADLLGRTYNVPVKTLDAISLDKIPAKARRKHPDWGNEQILTTYVLDELLPPRREADAVALLALTPVDLWPGEGWNFVFGQASLTTRVGVWSSARYGDPTQSDEAYQKCLERMLKVAVHETGHMFGIEHCTAYACGMNGSNHLEEADRQPLPFCPICSAKIWWSCGADPVKWHTGLVEFAEKQHLDEAAAYWNQCLQTLERQPAK